MRLPTHFPLFFFFNDTATTEIYTLSLHDALPIYNRAFALDARSGRPIWQYQRALAADIRPCCGRVNRGMAILGDKVFLGTLDAHIIALDAKTGSVVWDATAGESTQGDRNNVTALGGQQP